MHTISLPCVLITCVSLLYVCAFVTTDLFIDFWPVRNICEVWCYMWLCTNLGSCRRQADGLPETCSWGLPGDTGGLQLTTGVTVCRSGSFSAWTTQVTRGVRPARRSCAGRGGDALCSLQCVNTGSAAGSGSLSQLPTATKGSPEDTGVNNDCKASSPSRFVNFCSVFSYVCESSIKWHDRSSFTLAFFSD